MSAISSRVYQLMPEAPMAMNYFIILYYFEKTGDEGLQKESELWYSTIVIICPSMLTEGLACHNTFCSTRWKALPNFNDFVNNGSLGMLLLTSQ